MCCFILLKVCNAVEAKEIMCESVTESYLDYIGKLKNCRMYSQSVLNEPNMTFKENDESITGILFDRNKKIAHLPVKIDESFPSLMGYSAYACSIKGISKANFKGLNKLRYLSLQRNMIEIVPSDSFDDLLNLEYLKLSNFF